MILRSEKKELRIAFFAGSFNPFTIGHLSIVKRALPLFDKIVIGIGRNVHKQNIDTNLSSLNTIQTLFENENRIEVVEYYGLTTEYAKKIGAQFLLRGVRSITDYEYERNIADINRMISGIETIFLFALPEFEAISSSMIRELAHYGKDVTRFIPSKLE